MLERMRRKWNPSALLVRMQTGAATVETSTKFPQKTKNGTAFRPSNLTFSLENRPTQFKHMNWEKSREEYKEKLSHSSLLTSDGRVKHRTEILSLALTGRVRTWRVADTAARRWRPGRLPEKAKRFNSVSVSPQTRVSPPAWPRPSPITTTTVN